MRKNRYKRVMDFLNDSHNRGFGGPPTAWRSGDIRGGHRAYRTLKVRTENDAYEVVAWLVYDDEAPGTDHDVEFMLSREEAHRFAWWVFRWWAAEWFGLRRRLYYAALRRYVKGMEPVRDVMKRHGIPEPSAEVQQRRVDAVAPPPMPGDMDDD